MKFRFNSILQILMVIFAASGVLTGCRFSTKKAVTVKAVEATQDEQTQAGQSLQTFLAEIDKDNGQTWEQLSETLKASTTQATWSMVVASMKTLCGRNLGRGSAQSARTDDMPDAPKGRYYIFDISSKFERAELTERVVLVLENGQWKVAGYFRKKTVVFGGEAKKT